MNVKYVIPVPSKPGDIVYKHKTERVRIGDELKHKFLLVSKTTVGRLQADFHDNWEVYQEYGQEPPKVDPVPEPPLPPKTNQDDTESDDSLRVE